MRLRTAFYTCSKKMNFDVVMLWNLLEHFKFTEKQALFGCVRTRSYSLNRFQHMVTHIPGYICLVLAPGSVALHAKFVFGSFGVEEFCGT